MRSISEIFFFIFQHQNLTTNFDNLEMPLLDGEFTEYLSFDLWFPVHNKDYF